MRRGLPVLREEGRAGQMDCFGDGLLAEPATAPTVDDEVPRKPAFHVSKHVCNKDARAFECDASVADFWVGHDVPAQFDAPSVASHGANQPGKRNTLKQVLFNLLLNAREAMHARHNGYLGISAEQQGEHVSIKVKNTGDPIPPELLPQIFEPFQTSKPATRGGRTRCGGLGLALCRDLVEENGGTITVSSSLDSGTTFSMVLPSAAAVSH